MTRPDAMDRTVKDNPAQHRFEIALDGDDVAAAYYRIDDAGRVVLAHTEVPYEYSGQGIGSRLAQGVFDAIRASGRKAVLKCSFMVRYYALHPEYSDIVDG
ncbi:N-acetyltransferase [Rhizorhabdus wittichii]|uniref:N-acetyltransferase n=1 Tax=Rhizorhabdus wittichii TaxID=160791 RepID=A0A975HFP2_9SPHN|nr:GNAT family N-acetyltransferase [Rhizorhabdus wittichii]QTH23610.1 N-acetyltransferase [Rhizorhabdus wittichii]